MKRALGLLLTVGFVSALSGCAYSGAAGAGADKVVIARNDGFLFGILRKVYVCKVADTGLSNCQSADAP